MDAVTPDEHVALDARAVLEVRHDPIAVLVVAYERLSKMNLAAQASEQNLSKREPVDLSGHVRVGRMSIVRKLETLQDLCPLVVNREAVSGLAAGGDDEIVETRWEARMERTVAIGVDGEYVALTPRHERRFVALEHLNVNIGPWSA